MEIASSPIKDEKGPRFAFGENWRKFLSDLNEERIVEAEKSLKKALELEDMKGQSFLDAGCGSGLFSLAARRFGARVHSFDWDPSSVGCALELRRHFFPEDQAWTIDQGSALDEAYIESLGQYDVVYCWGVLHHTGDMWKGLELISRRVKPRGGKLFIAIYNDQGRKSRWWRAAKRTYCRLPRFFQPPMAFIVGAYLWAPRMTLDLLTFKPFHPWRNYGRNRGMSLWRDTVDWVGGYPFEVAKPEEIFQFYRDRGFTLRKLATAGGSLGNNEFVFESGGGRDGAASQP